MDYEIYDKLQLKLGGTADIYMMNCNDILKNSAADEPTKALLHDLCNATKAALDELAKAIAQSMDAVK